MKTRKKWIVFMAFTVAFVLSIAGCGNTIPAMNEKESEEMTEEVTKMGEDAASLDESIADTDEPVEQSGEADMTAEQTTEPDETIAPVETEEPAQTAEPDATEKPAETKKPATPVSTTAPTATPEPSAPTQTEKPVTTPAPTTAPTPAPTATPTPEPVHQHSWKEHVATTQVWVPNIVVIDDYEEQTTKYCHYICMCDYETDDPNDMCNHQMTMLLAGESGHSNFTNQTKYRTEQVKVGSHEEDHGYYETSSYVDYYYCDCGETKN